MLQELLERGIISKVAKAAKVAKKASEGSKS